LLLPRFAERSLDRLLWRVRLATVRRRGGVRMALASFPRSGNTWFRFLIEHATGEHTGIAAGRRPGRILPREEDGVVIKTHRRDSHRYTHVIHLVRNPFDAFDSFYDWKAATGWDWKYGDVSWDDFVRIMAPRWRDHTRHWLRAPASRYLIRYEDCHRDPFVEFTRLCEWMDRPIPPEKLREAIAAASFDRLRSTQSEVTPIASQFFRRGQVNRGAQRFSEAQRKWVVRVCRDELQACGYLELAAEECPPPAAVQ
jgi:hypothetical protein